MKFKSAHNIIGRGNVLVIDLENDNDSLNVGDKLTFEIRGIERINGFSGFDKHNIGLILKQIKE